jgi:vancomycin resistance protein VanJ
MGDFNTPPRTSLYRELTAQYKDAFEAAGYGFGWTYPSVRPLVRIDHILMNHRVEPRGCWVPKTSGSDHRPVVADLVVR